MTTPTPAAWPASALAALACAALLHTPAQAGLISGSWDPEFGSALPGLSWGAHAELLVPDACTNLSGTQSTASGACAGAQVLGVFLHLYNTGFTPPDWSNPAAYFSVVPDMASYATCDTSVAADPAFTSRCNGNFGNFFNLTALRIEGGNVVGLQSGVAGGFATSISAPSGPFSLPTNAQFNQFALSFGLTAPVLTCTTCPDGPIASQTEGLRQFLVTYTSNDTSAPKYVDGSGNALGALLDQNGRVLGLATSINGQPVPEPGGLALVATALATAALLRRRRPRA